MCTSAPEHMEAGRRVRKENGGTNHTCWWGCCMEAHNCVQGPYGEEQACSMPLRGERIDLKSQLRHEGRMWEHKYGGIIAKPPCC